MVDKKEKGGMTMHVFMKLASFLKDTNTPAVNQALYDGEFNLIEARL